MISGNKKKKKFGNWEKKKSFFLSITINKVIKIESYKKERIRLKKKKINYSTFLVMKEDASHKLLLYKRIKM